MTKKTPYVGFEDLRGILVRHGLERTFWKEMSTLAEPLIFTVTLVYQKSFKGS